MMSMLTILVILVAVGAMVQRIDVFERYFGDGRVALELVRDETIVRANTLTGIDVLANDLGIKDGDGAKLVIAKQPKCGRVFVRDQKIQYLPVERCVGSQIFNYAISGRESETPGEVMVVVRLAEPTQDGVTADAQRDTPAQAPMVPRAGDQRVGDSPALLAAQPSAGADTVGATVLVPAVPRPRALAIAGLPETAPGTALGGGGSAAAGVTFGGSGLAPNISNPASGLAQAPASAVVPVVPQPGPEATAPPAGSAAAATGDTEPATLALARVDPAQPAAGDTAGSGIERENGGLGANVARAVPQEIGSGGSGAAGSGVPADALAGARALGGGAELTPVDTTPPPAPTGGGVGVAQPVRPAKRLAALPAGSASCTTPPALILEVKPAGLTEVIVDSPCHAGTVARLSYDGLRFGVALDGAGAGTVAAIGFQQATDAVLDFAGGATVDFNIPFADTGRMARVVVIWEMPVDLDLHAFEFGAAVQSDGHVRPGRPRSFADVRRRGGGYLLGYQPVARVGQNLSVYTYWRRHGGRSGVVKLKLDFTDRTGRQQPDTCGGGALADPSFTVLRSVAGKMERPRRRRLATLDCAAVAGAADRYIGDAVDDMIILQR